MISVAKVLQRNYRFKTAGIARCFWFRSRLFALFAGTLAVCACEMPQQRSMFVFTGPIMGTDYRITVVSDSDVNEDNLHQELVKVMDQVNHSMSHYLPDSEINKINQASANQVISLSDDLNTILSEAIKISKFSMGAFDITLAPVIDIWGFGSRQSNNLPPAYDELEELSQSVGYQRLKLRDGTLTKAHSDTQLNLSAIAKGFAVDQVAEQLEKNQIHNYLIDIGGELRAAGLNRDSQVWRVAIEKPELLGGIQQIINLDNAAIATSGDYLNFVELEDQRYSHTIDAKTLSPVLHRLSSISVIDQSATVADALATAIMAMGEERGFEFAEQQQLAAFFVIRQESGEGVFTRATSKMVSYLSE